MTDETTHVEPSLSDLFEMDDTTEETVTEAEPEATEETMEATDEGGETETESEESETEVVEEKAEDDKYSQLEKQLKDTREYATQVNQKAQSIIQKFEAGEDLSAEEIQELKGSMKNPEPEANEMAEIVSAVGQQLPLAMQILKDNTDTTDEQLQAAVSAFDTFAASDPTIVKELIAQDPAARASYVLKRGKELVTAYEAVQEHGSLVAALTNKSSMDEESIRSEIEAEIKAKYEEKYKNYVSPMKKGKPKIGGSAPSTSTKSDESESISLQSIGLM